MTEQEIEAFFQKEFWGKNTKGSLDLAFKEFRYLILVEDVDPALIVTKYAEYNDMVLKEQRASKYIKDTHNWLKEKGYLDTYTTKDSKTRGYLSRWLKGLKYLLT